MKKLLLLALLIPLTAYADTGVFTYTAPTEREDNTPLSAEEIGGYNVFVNGELNDISPLLPTDTGFTLDLPSGEYIVTMTTLDTDGRESILSDALTIDVPFNPKAPSGVTVNITISIN